MKLEEIKFDSATMEKISYGKFCDIMRQHNIDTNDDEKKSISGVIVFTEDSFDKQYDERSRSYLVSSYNKAYRPNMGGYSIFGGSLDGVDLGVRLESYMRDEKGGKDGWKVEYCYIVPETA